MRTFYIIIFLALFQQCYAQDSTLSIFVKEIGWKISIPENFEVVEDSIQKNLNEKGAKLMGEANEVKISTNEIRNLFSTHNGNNLLYATIISFSEKKDGSYLKANEKMREMLYRTFAEKTPQAQLDSNTTSVTIDTLPFEKFTLGISLNKRPLITMCVLYRLYRGFDLGITYLYMNDWAQKAIEKAIFQSKFVK